MKKKLFAMLIAATVVIANSVEGSTSTVFASDIENAVPTEEILEMEEEESYLEEDIDDGDEENTEVDEDSIHQLLNTGTPITSESELRAALETDGTITLGDNISCQDNASLRCSANVILNLGGYTLSSDSCQLDIENKLTIQGNGKITHTPLVVDNNGKLIINSGAVLETSDISVSQNGYFEMNDGEICNVSSSYGIMNWGELHINGGSIHDCSVGFYNEGLAYFTNGKLFKNDDAFQDRNNGKIVMSGGVICDNQGGGCSLLENSIFTMTGGVISDNKNDGVFVTDKAHFTLDGGRIESNVGFGLTIDGDGSFIMNSGLIQANDENGVYLQSSDGIQQFSMTGGEIKGNSKYGVEIINGKFSMSGGIISSNHGGVYCSELDEATISLSGTPIIRDNISENGIENNCYRNHGFTGNHAINIIGELLSGSHIGLFIDDEDTGDFTLNYDSYNASKNPRQFFFSDRSEYAVSLNGRTGEAMMEKVSSDSLKNGNIKYVSNGEIIAYLGNSRISSKAVLYFDTSTSDKVIKDDEIYEFEKFENWDALDYKYSGATFVNKATRDKLWVGYNLNDLEVGDTNKQVQVVCYTDLKNCVGYDLGTITIKSANRWNEINHFDDGVLQLGKIYDVKVGNGLSEIFNASFGVDGGDYTIVFQGEKVNARIGTIKNGFNEVVPYEEENVTSARQIKKLKINHWTYGLLVEYVSSFVGNENGRFAIFKSDEVDLSIFDDNLTPSNDNTTQDNQQGVNSSGGGKVSKNNKKKKSTTKKKKSTKKSSSKKKTTKKLTKKNTKKNSAKKSTKKSSSKKRTTKKKSNKKR